MKANASEIRAIDVHGHYGTYCRPEFADLVNKLCSGDAETVLAYARKANTEWTVVSPLQALFPRSPDGQDVEGGNRDAAETAARLDGLLQWVVIHPRQARTYDQAREMLQYPRCMGIKIHGEEHLYPVAEFCDEIFRVAAGEKAVVLVHSGNEYTMPLDFVPFADRYPEMKLILAHLGNCGEKDADPAHQVRAIQASKHGNIYVDTSSTRSILPGLIEWAVAEVGVERILYGTDTPLYFAPNQRARIDHADLSFDQKRAILRDNALRILAIP